MRDNPTGPAVDEARALGIEINHGRAVIRAGGKLRVSSMTVQAKGGGPERTIPVDAILMSAGWTPSVHMFSQSRGKVAFDDATKRFLPGQYAQDCVRSARPTAPTASPRQSPRHRAGEKAASEAGGKAGKGTKLKAETSESWAGGMVGAAPGAGADRTVKAFVDFQNDVTAKDIRACRARRHALDRARQALHHQWHGDRPGQDLEHAWPRHRGRNAGQGHSVGRADDLPRALYAGHLRGDRQPWPRSAVRPDAQDGNPSMGRGQWRCVRGRRAVEARLVFPEIGEDMHAAVNRECVSVRKSAGLFDASTLGKIEVVGPDAAKFMELLYTNPWEKLEPGRCRYGIMLREDGFIYDDGVVGRLAPDRFHVTTTTGGAPRVMNHMEDYLQTEFPHLNVWLTSITEQWAVIAVQGPRSREIIQPLVEGIDMSDEAMPHMSVREGTICGVPTRLFRMSFTGDRGFEVNVPADYGKAVWEALWARAKSTAPAPTAPRRCTCCAPRRATSSSARIPTAR